MPAPETHFRNQGLSPLTWEEVLRGVESALAPAETQTFQRLHRAFTAYPAPHTLRSFYDFAAERDLLGLLAGFRYDRILDLAAGLTLALGPRASDLRLLDVGAGGGYIAAYLRDVLGAEVWVTDLSLVSRARLAAVGYRAIVVDSPEAAQEIGPIFDALVCADSLGEIHADEDGWLADPANLDDPHFAGELEARYGFAEKLATLRPLLAPGGAVLLYEPVPLPHFWTGAARALEAAGWRAEVLGPAPAFGLRLVPVAP